MSKQHPLKHQFSSHNELSFVFAPCKLI